MVTVLLRNFHRWFGEYSSLSAAEQELEAIEADYRPKLKNARDTKSDLYPELISDMLFEMDQHRSEIARIETIRRLRGAHHYGVPLPAKPRKRDEDNEHWRFTSWLEAPVLTDDGHRQLRHEIAREREIARKPVYDAAALIISVISIVIALIALFSGK